MPPYEASSAKCRDTVPIPRAWSSPARKVSELRNVQRSRLNRRLAKVRPGRVTLYVAVEMVQVSVVEIALGQVTIGIDPAIPQEGPVGTAGVHLGKVAGGNQHLLIGASLHYQTPSGVGDETAAPELQAALRVALVTDTVY